MHKILYLLWTTAVLSLCFSVLNTSYAGSSCSISSITCYEKTPTCYVTKDKSGCLDISYKKPVCAKGSCVCTVKACNKVTNY